MERGKGVRRERGEVGKSDMREREREWGKIQGEVKTKEKWEE